MTTIMIPPTRILRSQREVIMGTQEIQRFGVLDYVVFAAMLILSTAIGLYFAFTGGRQRTAEEVLLGNRKLHIIPVALSVVLSGVSAISVLGSPAEVYFYDLTYSIRIFATVYSFTIVILLFFPVYFRLNIASIYEVSLHHCAFLQC